LQNIQLNNIPPKKNFLYNLKKNKKFLISILNHSSLEQVYNFRVVKNEDNLTFKDIGYEIFDTNVDETFAFKYITESIVLKDIVPICFQSTIGWAALEFQFEECCEDMNMYEKLEEALKNCL